MGEMFLFPLAWEGHLPPTALLLLWRRQSHMGSQANRVLPTTVVFFKHPGTSEMLYELKLPVPISNSADVVELLIFVLPED